ncbi:hypothetical protein BP00DRAFT_498486 [Aspergillus indologenus CBS 114.80]|uniref:Signal peptidase complex subunit 1 n=1 Tax=Aspergillus indologenus CBS 114.80 TaxID=1450541 RepID=A0A2V5HXH3_9EURO|nr:hypothetical protein BP00DRAFT_498486 [Aspergillus indologenus CBS 114.80]
MDNLLSPIQDALEGQIDYQGQHMAELLSTVLLIISGVSTSMLDPPMSLFLFLAISVPWAAYKYFRKAIAFLVGYIQQDIHLTLWVGLAGTAATGLVVIPPWPMYNKRPEKWLAPTSAGMGVAGVMVDGVKVA